MGIDHIELLHPDPVEIFGGFMTDELQGGDPAAPAKPPDRTDLPAEGDPDKFLEEPVPEADFDTSAATDKTMDNAEEAEQPNDLSEVDKEFEE